MKKVNMLVNPLELKSVIHKEIYGHFAEHLGRCVYGGIYVGEDSPVPNIRGIRKDIIEAFKHIRVPVLRWPGGCFADTYDWRGGVGKKSERAKIMNVNWGNVCEDNSFGTHEFFDLCELIGAQPYLAGNLGGGSPRELADWIDYITFDGSSPMADLRRKNGREKPWKLKYLGIGNESWGCGGNMRCEHYADEFRRYSSFCRDYAGNKLYKVACGGDEKWNDTLIRVLSEDVNMRPADAITLHYYTIIGSDFEHKGSAVDFTAEEYYQSMKNTQWIDRVIERNKEIMDIRDPDKKLGLIVDEWGCWYDVEEGTNPGFLYQQNTMRDAVVAANYLNIFNKHSDRVVMANLAQAVNVLQALVLTEGEKMIKTPTYHVMDMFKEHMDAHLVHSSVENEYEGGMLCLSQSASLSNGKLHITLANASLINDYEVFCAIPFVSAGPANAKILTGEVHSHNTFDAPETVAIRDHNVAAENGALRFAAPKCSVIEIEVEIDEG